MVVRDSECLVSTGDSGQNDVDLVTSVRVVKWERRTLDDLGNRTGRYPVRTNKRKRRPSLLVAKFEARLKRSAELAERLANAALLAGSSDHGGRWPILSNGGAE